MGGGLSMDGWTAAGLSDAVATFLLDTQLGLVVSVLVALWATFVVAAVCYADSDDVKDHLTSIRAFVSYDARERGEGVVAVDCTHCALPTLTHHKESTTPRGLRGDTSTDTVFNALHAGWAPLRKARAVTCNHVRGPHWPGRNPPRVTHERRVGWRTRGNVEGDAASRFPCLLHARTREHRRPPDIAVSEPPASPARPRETRDRFRSSLAGEILTRSSSPLVRLPRAAQFDIDGVCSVWSLMHPAKALRHEELLREAALIGDMRELRIDPRTGAPDGPLSSAALKLCCWMNAVERERFTRPFEVGP